MFLTYLILAFSLSIDSIGIGITYGLRNTRLSNISKLILFIISITFTTISLEFGKILSSVLPDFISIFIGSFILMVIGITTIFMKNNSPFDLDNSKIIDWKEACFLGFALSIDSVSVSIGGGITGLDGLYFPILVASFHMFFLFLGNFLGKKITGIKNFPDNICNILSGFLLIIIGITRLFI